MKWIVIIIMFSPGEYVNVMDSQQFEVKTKQMCREAITEARINLAVGGLQIRGACIKVK